MNNSEKIADIFKACATCKHYDTLITSSFSAWVCKEHVDFPIDAFECHMSIICDDFEFGGKVIKEGKYFELDNKANFRRKAVINE